MTTSTPSIGSWCRRAAVNAEDKYRLVKRLATGGMAEVWLAMARIAGLERPVVLKRILPNLASDPVFVEMFLDEARIAAQLNHPNIVQIYELGEQDGRFYIAMEYIHGEDVSRIMRKAWAGGRWVDLAVSLRIVAQACEGLAYAHARSDSAGRPLGLVHRDVSPHNILVSFEGGVKLVDFGIAKAANQSTATRAGYIKGKYAYMSPEQARGLAVDRRSDIYSLGLVLYELVSGRRPFQRDSDVATLDAAARGEIPRLASVVRDVDAGLDALVMRALAKEPAERYPDAGAFQTAIEDYLFEKQLRAGSTRLAETMRALFRERLDIEAQLSQPAPETREPTPLGDRGPAVTRSLEAALAPTRLSRAEPSARATETRLAPLTDVTIDRAGAAAHRAGSIETRLAPPTEVNVEVVAVPRPVQRPTEVMVRTVSPPRSRRLASAGTLLAIGLAAFAVTRWAVSKPLAMLAASREEGARSVASLPAEGVPDGLLAMTPAQLDDAPRGESQPRPMEARPVDARAADTSDDRVPAATSAASSRREDASGPKRRDDGAKRPERNGPRRERTPVRTHAKPVAASRVGNERPAGAAEGAVGSPAKSREMGAAAAPATPGVLELVVLGGWADIRVDGVPRGRAPIVNRVELPPGEHVIELSNPYRVPHRGTVVIEPGRTRRYTATLRAPEEGGR